MPQAFISYASADGDFAELTRNKLEWAGLQVWVDQGQLRAGEEWRNAIDDGIASSGSLIVVISTASSKSPYVTYEWAFALGKGKKIVPILLDPVDMHPRLEIFQYLDFSHRQNRPWDEFIQELKHTAEPRKKGAGPTGAQRETTNADYGIAKDQILEYLNEKKINLVSFEAVRTYIDPAYDDDFLMEVIRRHRGDLLRRVLEGGAKPGVGRK